MPSLLAVDLGLRTGLALFSGDGRLRWYRSQNFGSAPRLRRAVHGIFAAEPEIEVVVLEGGGPLADIWEKEAERRGVRALRIGAEAWRRELLIPREQRTGAIAKHSADGVARRVIEWSGATPSDLAAARRGGGDPGGSVGRGARRMAGGGAARGAACVDSVNVDGTLPRQHCTEQMAKDRAIFQDERGRGWLVEILYGHPAPTERGYFGARFLCPEDPDEPARVGYVELEAVASDDEELLQEALAESEPAREVGEEEC